MFLKMRRVTAVLSAIQKRYRDATSSTPEDVDETPGNLFLNMLRWRFYTQVEIEAQAPNCHADRTPRTRRQS
jgi:hypothetical protein